MSTARRDKTTNSRNPRLGHLRRRLRMLQESRPEHRVNRRATPSTTNTGYEQQLGHSPGVKEDVVVLNFQNMDQDCALRLNTTNRGISDIHNQKQKASLNRLTTDEKGQLRYFGYSSLMRLVSVLPSSPTPTTTPTTTGNSNASSRSGGGEPEIGSEAVMLADSPDTHHHLIGLFFRYQHDALPILDEELFRESYARGERTEYYSTFLLHSLLLRALKFAALPYTQQLKRVYLRRARDQLLFEIENPSIATIPALCMFGSYLAGEGSDRGCWLYPGLAFRLLYDFGLHEDCGSLIDSGLLTEKDRRIRLSILYHCYVFDKQYSSFQGRPTAVRLEDFSCPLPTEAILGPKYKLTAAWVGLASILEEILPIINGRQDSIYQDASVAKLSQASEKLRQWFKSLPPELQWTSSTMTLPPSPAMCAIHVQFLSVTILLNRPFAAYMLKSSKTTVGRPQLNGQTPEVSQELCTTSGIRISKLLLAYRLHLGATKCFSTINPACLSAAMALTSDIVSAGGGGKKEVECRWLAAVLETLREITPTYPVAGRSYMVLCAILKACGLSGVVPVSDQPGNIRNDQGQGQIDTGILPMDQERSHLGHGDNSQQAGGISDELVWNMGESLGWEFCPMLDDVHDIGLTDFYPRLTPWAPPPDAGGTSWMEGSYM